MRCLDYLYLCYWERTIDEVLRNKEVFLHAISRKIKFTTEKKKTTCSNSLARLELEDVVTVFLK